MADPASPIAAIVRDPLWLAHRYDPQHDAVHFVRLSRADHRAATFLTDEYLAGTDSPLILARGDVVPALGAPAPIHFVFHSAYCCSTLVARALDIEGVSMGLKEPVILNDLVGWRRRGGEPKRIAEVLDLSLALLARPFDAGGSVVVKPSNVVNPLSMAMLAMRPEARALLLHAPLRIYLGSIARKGMWGRLWVRELLSNLLADGLIDYGFTPQDYLRQTDLQVAAIGWLAQQRLFERLTDRFGPDRVRALDSETLVARPAEALSGLSALFRLGLDEAAIDRIATGPAFTRHSKSGGAFGRDGRESEQRDAASVHADEVDKVAIWAEAVAAGAGQRLDSSAPLLV